ncbi:lateral signaling target protein 2 homolog isoform X2 [Prorops nasuta]|uniref:lateral signaling target protein 2 homolog isoform X2 n=1 Tax=Prorops nasuta TaxID=863751 RepID=UPI0034CFACF4
MESIRKWFYKPKKDDTSLLAQFFFADESLNAIACELDSFDGRQEPERCTTLVNQLRHCQDKVLTICNQIMDELIPESRANRDFRVKFPDDVMQENLAGQLWFGAECLAAGSSIMNRETESSAMRPLAKALTKSLEIVRNLLREHALKGHMNLKYLYRTQYAVEPSLEKLIESLKIFDRLFADFELCYVGAMVPVKSTHEYEQQELVCVLFSETLQNALRRLLLKQADVDNYEPALMFTIPRLAIVSGLLAPPGGPLCLNSPDTISEMFQPFRPLLLKIRELLWTLDNRELSMLEKLLCSSEDLGSGGPGSIHAQPSNSVYQNIPDLKEFVYNFYTSYPNYKNFSIDFYTVTKNTGSNMDEVANDVVQFLEEEVKINRYSVVNKTGKKDVEADYKKQNINSPKLCFDDANISTNGFNNNDNKWEWENETANESSHGFYYDKSFIRSTESENELINSSEDSNGSHNSTELSPSFNILERRRMNDNNSEEGSFAVDISQILENSENTEISQTQYLLNQVSHENNVTSEAVQVQNCLSDLNSKKLISETNKTLSNFLLDGDSQNEISEQTDSGICTVISSENTSLYEKSPEEKKTFVNETRSNETEIEEDLQENTTYSCSNFNSSNSVTLKNPCLCQVRRTKTRSSLDHSVNAAKSIKTMSDDQRQSASNLLFNMEEANEELVGLPYGNGYLPISNSHHSNFQVNYSENWENLNLNIEACTTKKQNLNDSKHENYPSTSRNINMNGTKVQNHVQNQIATMKTRRERQKSHQCKNEKSSQTLYLRAHEIVPFSKNETRTTASIESSKSNSRDRYIKPRIINYGASLQPNQNTLQIPSFSNCSPRASPGPHCFAGEQLNVFRKKYRSICPQTRKDNRKYRSDETRVVKKSCNRLNNDGLGPRTKEGDLVTEILPAGSPSNNLRYDPKNRNSNKAVHAITLLNPSTMTGSQSYHANRFSTQNAEADTGSSYSSSTDLSSETSEFQSDYQDDEEIALAMQAAEIANQTKIRAKFRSSEDLVHRLFVCISGVADQLQTNFASDLRNILKCVFLMNSSQSMEDIDFKDLNLNSIEQPSNVNYDYLDTNSNINNELRDSLQEDDNVINQHATMSEHIFSLPDHGEECVERAPIWIPDNDAPKCMACQAVFTVVRRRHHCRNCGKIFCGRCSGNNVPLPRYGHIKPVRVCNRCFLYQVTPFTVSHVTSTN